MRRLTSIRRLRERRPRGTTVVIALAVIAALAVVSPVFGLSGSIKKAIRKEVAKQIGTAKGPAGQAFDANATLPSGQTLTGGWGIAGGASQNAVDSIQFVPRLPTGPGAGAVHRVASGASTAACPGPGQAAPGNLCVYEVAGADASFQGIANPATHSDPGAARDGALIYYVTSAPDGNFHGTWAVTAP